MKLYYFPTFGRGEVIRLLFAAGNKHYEDIRIPRDQWPSRKPEMPLEKMPVLEIDGVKYPQSIAIARYVARECGLYGSNSLDGLKIDAVVDTCLETYDQYRFMKNRATPEEKKAKLPEYVDKTIPNILDNLSKLMKLYGSNNYFVGNKLTWADIFVYQYIQDLKLFKPDLLKDYPHLAANVQHVKENEGIKKYLKERPT